MSNALTLFVYGLLMLILGAATNNKAPWLLMTLGAALIITSITATIKFRGKS